MIYFIVMSIIITIILNLRLIIIIVYIYLVPNNFPLIICIINISDDIQVEISVHLILKLDKALYMHNFSLCILLPDYGSCTGEPKHVAYEYCCD